MLLGWSTPRIRKERHHAAAVLEGRRAGEGNGPDSPYAAPLRRDRPPGSVIPHGQRPPPLRGGRRRPVAANPVAALPRLLAGRNLRLPGPPGFCAAARGG